MIATWNRRAARSLGLLACLVGLLAGCQSLPGADDPTGSEPRAERTRKPTPARPDRAPETVVIAPVDVSESAAPEDLWALIRASFSLDHEADHPAVRAEIEAWRRFPNHFQNMQTQLQLYLPYIHQQTQARGMPGELALLPILESGMNPQAHSISGAAGLWQFIPATADRMNVPRNWWFDGRRDLVLSTRAALDYLEYLYGQFEDWRLAIVSYNAGEGTVRRALQSAPGGGAQFWSLRLPPQGVVFVPKLFALAEIVNNPELHGMVLPEVHADPGFVTLDTGGQLEVARTAAALGVEEEHLYLLNPGLNRTVTPPEGPHLLHVPAALADAADTWIASLAATERVQWDRIQVRSGDTLGVLARRHGTDVRTLRQINNLDGDRLRAGQFLFIPGAASTGTAPGLAVSAAPGRPAATGNAHVVRAGETLWGIARAYRVGLDRLMAVNGMTQGQTLRIGQRLIIP